MNEDSATLHTPHAISLGAAAKKCIAFWRLWCIVELAAAVQCGVAVVVKVGGCAHERERMSFTNPGAPLSTARELTGVPSVQVGRARRVARVVVLDDDAAGRTAHGAPTPPAPLAAAAAAPPPRQTLRVSIKNTALTIPPPVSTGVPPQQPPQQHYAWKLCVAARLATCGAATADAVAGAAAVKSVTSQSTSTRRGGYSSI